MLPKVCAWTVITFTENYWISPMHSNVTIKNVSWLHFSWATLYIPRGRQLERHAVRVSVSVSRHLTAVLACKYDTFYWDRCGWRDDALVEICWSHIIWHRFSMPSGATASPSPAGMQSLCCSDYRRSRKSISPITVPRVDPTLIN